MFTRAVLLSATLLAIPAAASDDPWRFVDPGSRMVMGVKWRAIQESPAGTRFRREIRESLPMSALPGMSFLSGIDRILVASAGQPSMTVVLAGEFDLAKVRASVSKRSRRAMVQNVEIFESTEKGSGRMALALVSTEILLLGDTASLVRAVGAPAGRDSLVLARARRMDEHNDFWILSTVAPAEVGADNLPVPLPMRDVRGLEMGLAVTDGVGMELSMQMASAEAAKKAKSEFEKTIKLAGKEKNRPDLAGLDRHMSLTAEREYVRMSFQIDAAQLEQRMQAYNRTRVSQPQPQQQAQAQPPALPPRPTNGKPVIWNADPQ